MERVPYHLERSILALRVRYILFAIVRAVHRLPERSGCVPAVLDEWRHFSEDQTIREFLLNGLDQNSPPGPLYTESWSEPRLTFLHIKRRKNCKKLAGRHDHAK